jgi:hypothetical protein
MATLNIPWTDLLITGLEIWLLIASVLIAVWIGIGCRTQQGFRIPYWLRRWCGGRPPRRKRRHPYDLDDAHLARLLRRSRRGI